jgi:hypothetical protein
MKRVSKLLVFFSFLLRSFFSVGNLNAVVPDFSAFIQPMQADTLQPARSELQFKEYHGKIIRRIVTTHLGFEKSIPNLNEVIDSKTARAGNNFHSHTKEKIIRENIFIEEGIPLNMYRLADNERLLRDLEFILDSRIYIRPVENTDSVDVVFITRDVFSLGAFALPMGNNDLRFGAQEANLLGTAQKLQFTGVYNSSNQPTTGIDLLYQKTNLFGSYVNVSYQYTELDAGRSIGNENESASVFRLSRPLYNPFARWTGALEISTNWSKNITQKEATEFADYKYNVQDAWFGYTLGLQKNATSRGENRNRIMIAARYYNQVFDTKPTIPLSREDSARYSDRAAALGQITFFKQNFLKTQYVYGFGRTEDIPAGYRISFIGGWERLMNIERPYMGTDIVVNMVAGTGAFYTAALKLGNYLNEDLIEDAEAQLSLSRYSKLIGWKNNRLRNYTDINFASQLNQTLKPKLDINDMQGVMGFTPDSLQGSKRLRLRNELVWYTTLKPFGFHLAPVFNIDLAFIGQQYQPLMKKENFYSGFSGGLKARNENLIFNTVELRVFYYPTTVEDINQWQAEIRISKRLKYPTTLVTAPKTIYDSN